MAKKVWTAAELEAMSPAERDPVFQAGIEADTSAVPAEFLDRVRERAEQHIANADSGRK